MVSIIFSLLDNAFPLPDFVCVGVLAFHQKAETGIRNVCKRPEGPQLMYVKKPQRYFHGSQF